MSKASFGPARFSASRSATVVCIRSGPRARRSLRAVFLRPPSSSTALAVRDALDRRLQAPLSACWTAAARAAEVVRAPTRSNQTADTNVSDLPRKHRERASLRRVLRCTMLCSWQSSSGRRPRQPQSAGSSADYESSSTTSAERRFCDRWTARDKCPLASVLPAASSRKRELESLARRRARLRTLAFVAT